MTLPSDKLMATLPPWRAFPDFDPRGGAPRQGAEEQFFLDGFDAFWLGLSTAERSTYLDYWDASPAWRDALVQYYDTPPASPADVRESETLFAERRAARATEGWWGRLRRP
ncbi:MAG: hypothetical protein MUF00_19690 [Gemmatimonadaceae bacterium]|jgi:hypothetical protein|nr:hypothetical protein [Gemmatimonadaceae bacterium]